MGSVCGCRGGSSSSDGVAGAVFMQKVTSGERPEKRCDWAVSREDTGRTCIHDGGRWSSKGKGPPEQVSHGDQYDTGECVLYLRGSSETDWGT